MKGEKKKHTKAEIRRLDAALDEAREIVRDFMAKHMSATAPCLIGALMEVFTEMGGGDLLRASFLRACTTIDEIQAEMRKVAN